jgi:hypothetical protein
MAAIELEDRLDRSGWGHELGLLKRASGEAQQVTESGADLAEVGRGRSGATAGGQMIVEERADGRPSHVLGCGAPGAEPGAEVLDGQNTFPDGPTWVAARVEVSDVGRDPISEEVGPDALEDARSKEESVENRCPPFGSLDRPGAWRIMQTTSKAERERMGEMQVLKASSCAGLRIIGDRA